MTSPPETPKSKISPLQNSKKHRLKKKKKLMGKKTKIIEIIELTTFTQIF